MNKTVNFSGTRKNQWGCRFLHYDFSSRNRRKKPISKQSDLQTVWYWKRKEKRIKIENKKDQKIDKDDDSTIVSMIIIWATKKWKWKNNDTSGNSNHNGL